MDITDAILAAAIKIQMALGPGLPEGAYKLCLAHALRLGGHRAIQEVRLDITDEGYAFPTPTSWISWSTTRCSWRPRRSKALPTCTSPR